MDRKVIILPNQTDHAVNLCILYDKRDALENRPLEGMGGKKNVGARLIATSLFHVGLSFV